MTGDVEILIKDGGALPAASHYGAGKVVGNYKVMRPVEAALPAASATIANGQGGDRENVGKQDIRGECR